MLHMIGLIIYGEIQRRIKQNSKPLKCKMAFPEIISNLKRLKRFYANDGTSTQREFTAKQKIIFKLLEIPLPE